MAGGVGGVGGTPPPGTGGANDPGDVGGAGGSGKTGDTTDSGTQNLSPEQKNVKGFIVMNAQGQAGPSMVVTDKDGSYIVMARDPPSSSPGTPFTITYQKVSKDKEPIGAADTFIVSSEKKDSKVFYVVTQSNAPGAPGNPFHFDVAGIYATAKDIQHVLVQGMILNMLNTMKKDQDKFKKAMKGEE